MNESSKNYAPPASLVEADAEQDEQELEERLWLASQGQKMVIYSILLNLLLRAVERSQVLPGVVLELLFVGVMAYTLLGVVRICSGLGKSQNQKILFMVLSFFPLLNLVILVYLSVKTSRMLRAAGWQVGLLGARP